MVVVGPEDPLVAGIFDFLKNDDQLKLFQLSVRRNLARN
jgi:phosphoribosylamine-glycine ligase